jgi:pimeloyl-ACP methyl ester carboxylesterase
MISISRCAIMALTVALFPCSARAQAPKFDDPKLKLPDEKSTELIKHRIIKLTDAIKSLPATTAAHVRPDVEIYLKAGEWAVRHNEFYDGGKAALTALDQGLLRAKEAAEGKPAWLTPQGKQVSRAYRSKVDGSLQPYAVSFPRGYGDDKNKKWRLDITLHGRDGTICETKFLAQHNGKETPKDNDFIQIDIFGRGNNAYRWAGETDVFEAMENFINVEKLLGRDLIDPKRVVLRGFSMGGAGTWHLGLQHPDRWCVIGPGAGFTTTHAYVKSLPTPLPYCQEPLLHIYDAVDYAENAANLPIVAYSGEKDAQKAAADNIEKRLKELKINTMTHLIGPGLMHQFPAEWQAKAEAEYVKYAGAGKGRPVYPDQVDFVTYTLKFPRCDWVECIQLERHYEQARVVAKHTNKALNATTKNVRVVRLARPPEGLSSVVIDGQAVIDGQPVPPSASFVYVKVGGKWAMASPPVCDGTRKLAGMQGPIDDAFTTGFVCVKGTGAPWSEAMNQAATAQLERFQKEWNKWMRGDLPVKTDAEITEADLANKNLVLFGDPGSNSLIARALPKLPFAWNKDQLVVDGQKYESDKYLPLMIFPNPLNPKRYIVLNSGHTFHEAEFKGTNALLFPRLGDYAVVRPLPTAKDPAAFEVMKSGLFNDSWRFDEK